MRRISILVTHLLGTGHLSRALTLARAFGDAGLEAQLISGGMLTGHLDSSGLNLVQLPPVRSDGTSFTTLLDDAGAPASVELMQARTHAIAEALQDFSPDALVTELFPFGRRVLRAEFKAALRTAKTMPNKPLVFSSIRDILAPPSSEKKAAETEAWLQDYYDGVLVHSDPAVLPLQASWPVTPALAGMLHYTGFIAGPPSPAGSAGPGDNEILVTAGGGPVGRRLFDTAVQASRLYGSRRWRLLVGGADAPAVCGRLNAATQGAPIVAEPARADYRGMLMRCAAAVGQCGYNTAVDWLQAGVPGVFVPFAEAGEVEQTLRASSLRDRYGFGMITEDDLTPENLAAAAGAAVQRGRFCAEGVSLDGAAKASAMLAAFLDRRG